MAEDSPLVSIAMPVRNCQHTLAAAIRSILAQMFTRWELLLMEDGSTDRTLAIAKRFMDPRIKIFSDDAPRGIVPRLNQAIDLSAGKYLARMDGDDVAYPDRLLKQVEYLEQHPAVDVLGGQMLIFKGAGKALGRRASPLRHEEICCQPANGFLLAHATVLGKVDFFRRYRYRSEALLCEDQDLWLRAYRASCFANLPEIVYGCREDRLDLKKIFTARRAYSKILFRTFLQQGRVDWAMCAVGWQAAKMLLDSVAVGTGLNYRLLRHRARPITDAEAREWADVWMLVSQDGLT